MARPAPFLGGGGATLDILLDHQPLVDEAPRRRADRRDIGGGVAVALQDRGARVACGDALLGTLGKGGVAAEIGVERPVPEAAGPYAPHGIGPSGTAAIGARTPTRSLPSVSTAG